MALRTIREFGDEVLNKECKEVTKMTLRTKVLINDMLDTMYEAMGVGLAAPQVTYIMNDLIAAGIDVNPDAITVEEARDNILKHFNVINNR